MAYGGSYLSRHLGDNPFCHLDTFPAINIFGIIQSYDDLEYKIEAYMDAGLQFIAGGFAPATDKLKLKGPSMVNYVVDPESQLWGLTDLPSSEVP